MGILNQEFITRKNTRNQLIIRRKARVSATLRRNKRRRRGKILMSMSKYIKYQRNEIKRDLFQEYNFSAPPVTIEAIGEIGIESDEGFQNFIELGKKIIHSNSRDLQIDFSNCVRIWPSTITQLCSLAQWYEVATMVHKQTNSLDSIPRIASTSPNSTHTDSYINQCGFYDYVGRALRPTSNDVIYDTEKMVKLKRETQRNNIEEREGQIVNLVRKYSTLDDDQFEYFRNIIIVEIMNNVVEHGKSYHDQGWWLMAQYHPAHKFISICIADNGIGFRLSLTSGPQKDQLGNTFPNSSEHDGDFLELAFQNRISGAIDAKVKETVGIQRKYPRGASRGNGLARIKDACKESRIKLAVLSHFGYIILDENGDIFAKSSENRRVFAGTLYNIVIPAK
jgi:anti-sigma regulatory factor (Ser/Thr protein kinase)